MSKRNFWYEMEGVYNNPNNTTQRYNQYNGPSQTRGGILAMLPISIYTNENIVKVPTTSTISPYLQIIIIKNKSLTPITILNIYMPSHLEDIHPIPEIQDQIHKITLQHSNHIIILTTSTATYYYKGEPTMISQPHPTWKTKNGLASHTTMASRRLTTQYVSHAKGDTTTHHQAT